MGKFVIKKTATGFRFNLKATNGEIVAVSETYTTLQSCKKGIASVQANAPKAEIENQLEEGFETLKNPKFEVYQDKAGEFRFRLKAKNGQIIATGESYKAVKSCLNGIASVKKNAVDSEIVDAE